MSAETRRAAISFRFAESTVDELRRHAKRAGRSRQTELAERYLIEGMRQDDHPLVYFRGSPGSRRPMVLGSRLAVADVIGTIRQNENSVEAASSYLEIPVGQVEAALAYYADYKDEVDDDIAEREQIAAEAEERWRRQREALA